MMHLGYRAHGARSGAEAVRFMESHRVDIVLTDYRMGSMNGVQLRDLIRNGKQEIPVILMTGEGDPGLQVGFDGFLQKPFSMNELRKEVERVRSSIGD
jgi:CheY-like chemotaxis protein